MMLVDICSYPESIVQDLTSKYVILILQQFQSIIDLEGLYLV